MTCNGYTTQNSSEFCNEIIAYDSGLLEASLDIRYHFTSTLLEESYEYFLSFPF